MIHYLNKWQFFDEIITELQSASGGTLRVKRNLRGTGENFGRTGSPVEHCQIGSCGASRSRCCKFE